MKTFSLILLLSILFSLTGIRLKGADIYVSVKGSDLNPGSKAQPVATVASALRKARELRRLNDPSIKNGIHIIIEKGFYKLSEPVFIRPEDSGTSESPTMITALPGEKVVLSGGVEVKGWQKAKGNIAGLPKEAQGKVWVTDAPELGNKVLEFRQLWVNGKKAVRARDRDLDHLNRILSWNFDTQTCEIPKPKDISISGIKGMEMVIHQWWAIANLRIKSVKIKAQKAELSFMQPESRIQSEHPWPAPWFSVKTGNSAFYLTNAIEFLDQPGEWYEDLNNRRIYYWPESGQDPEAENVMVPYLETLLKIEGTIDHRVSNVLFKGISFQHSTWLRPSEQGNVPHQAGMYMLDAYKLKVPGTAHKKTLENQAWVGRPAAAVKVSYADHTSFESCRFEHLASTGLDYEQGTQDNEIKGNLFKDIGGSAVLIGTFSKEATEVHLPYRPSDQREICSNEMVANNLITNVSNEDWGCVGIGAGYVRGIQILHNEISDVSYTGISVGWGWTKELNVMKNNIISNNRITHYAKYMYDVSGIYTLSAQPGSVISGNVVDSIYKARYAHDPEHWFYLYTDEGSSYFTVKNNWTPAIRYLQNANGPGNIWKNNGPAVRDSIKFAAGLEPEYQYLLKERIYDKDQVVNKAEAQHPVILEIIHRSADHDHSVLLRLMEKNGLPASDIYQWKNHTVIFGNIEDPEGLHQQLLSAFPNARVKLYNDLFYNFNRKTQCGKETVGKWDNIILTANLVKDETLQKEYLNYHKTQFEKWPEVSNGFCNADFQQLLVFRNGRQLMLIISIPKGASLDQLNPKTTENNPKADEWNEIMKKYQEGIPGTKQGEVWVFFKQISNKD